MRMRHHAVIAARWQCMHKSLSSWSPRPTSGPVVFPLHTCSFLEKKGSERVNEQDKDGLGEKRRTQRRDEAGGENEVHQLSTTCYPSPGRRFSSPHTYLSMFRQKQKVPSSNQPTTALLPASLALPLYAVAYIKAAWFLISVRQRG
ncbi:hypothetical protein JOB18_045239 [Solea senegalensis]|uniref:Uncharacterized protein n=1 Tax=Solea senegalensis TaxID=28829 RepID=A0AAV6R9W2_SOLSE|nr:hypothetical protein JOB18_045239 [Solea senegalensis]